jgi:hypothetical protein
MQKRRIFRAFLPYIRHQIGINLLYRRLRDTLRHGNLILRPDGGR